MKMNKLFSVITINYNNLHGLQRTVESVMEQSAADRIEFIVIDGASTDGSVDYLEKHKARIDILVSEKDQGIYDAMNKGLSLAKCEYVWFVNSGDAIYSKVVTEKLVPGAEAKVPVLFGDTMFIDRGGKELGLISRLKPQGFPEKLDSGSFRYGMNICHQSFIVRKEICPPFNTKYRQAADIDWIMNILDKNPENARLPFIVSKFETGGSSYQNARKAWMERFRVLESHYGTVPNFMAHVIIFARRMLFNLKLWKP